MPFSIRRATQPAPMTPPPMAAAFFTTVIGSPALLQLQLLAHLGRTEETAAHGARDGRSPLDELTVGRQLTLAEPDVVLQAEPDVAAGQHRHGRIGQIGRASCRERVCQYV